MWCSCMLSCKARLYLEKSAQRIASHSLSALVKGKLNTSGGHGTDSCTRHSARSHCNNECECVTSRRSPHGATGRKSSCASAGGGSRANHSGWRANHGRRRATVNRTWLHWPWCRIARPCHWHGNTAHAWCRCRNSLRGCIGRGAALHVLAIGTATPHTRGAAAEIAYVVALAVVPHCTSLPLARQHRTRVVPLQK